MAAEGLEQSSYEVLLNYSCFSATQVLRVRASARTLCACVHSALCVLRVGAASDPLRMFPSALCMLHVAAGSDLFLRTGLCMHA